MTRKSYLRGILPALLLLMSVSAESAFDDPVSYAVGEGSAGVTIGDIDGDGLADVAVANVFSGDVSLLINDGSGLQPEQRIDHGPGEARYVVIEDIDDDGDRDLVVLLRGGDSLIVVLRNQGDGSFAPPEPHGTPNLTYALRLADVDLDGDPDALVVAGFTDEITVTLLSNDGSGSFEVAGSYQLAAVLFVYVADIDVADLDGDGYPDVVGCTADAVAVLLNSGQGGFLPAAPVELGHQAPVAVQARDVNRDSRPDLVVASCGSGDDELRVGLNDGAGGFVLSDVVQLTGACHSITNPMGVASGYLDDDTVIDLVYASRGTDSVRLLHGVGDGTFTASEILPTDPEPTVVAAGDVKGDGSHDVISWNIFSDTIVVTTNEQCALLLEQTVRADASGFDYFWSTSLPYLAVRGDFVASEDVGEFVVDLQFSGDANVLHDADSPVAGSGFWYLVRPDCDGASWTSAGASELDGRDLALP
jgi:hypothetical protein